MWVSKAQWDRLNKRLNELESFQRDARHFRYFTVYQGSPFPPEPIPPEPITDNKVWYWRNVCPYNDGPSQEIGVKDVLEHVLRHLGIRLNYDAGQPARVKIDLPEKKKK